MEEAGDPVEVCSTGEGISGRHIRVGFIFAQHVNQSTRVACWGSGARPDISLGSYAADPAVFDLR
jgi:hypothetical protein